jgi:hypothetical protein
MVAVHLADIDQLFLNDLFCVFDHDESLLAADHIIEALDLILEHMVKAILDFEKSNSLILTEDIKIVGKVQFIFIETFIIQILIILELCECF